MKILERKDYMHETDELKRKEVFIGNERGKKLKWKEQNKRTRMKGLEWKDQIGRSRKEGLEWKD